MASQVVAFYVGKHTGYQKGMILSIEIPKTAIIDSAIVSPSLDILLLGRISGIENMSGDVISDSNHKVFVECVQVGSKIKEVAVGYERRFLNTFGIPVGENGIVLAAIYVWEKQEEISNLSM